MIDVLIIFIKNTDAIKRIYMITNLSESINKYD